MTVCTSAAAPWRSLATSARPRGSRSCRSPIGWAARRRRSRRTSTTRPGRRRGRSRPATKGCAAAAAPTRSPATARAMRTRTARRATRARSSGGGPASAWSRPCATGAAVRQAAVLVRLVADAARRRGGEALRRLNHGCWPSASVVTAVWGSWSAARRAVGDAVNSARQPSATDGRREVGDWAQSAFLCPIPGNPPLYPGV